VIGIGGLRLLDRLLLLGRILWPDPVVSLSLIAIAGSCVSAGALF